MRAVFLDRDGVLVKDSGSLIDKAQIEVLSGVPAALSRLHSAAYLLVVVTNQAVVARGLATEEDVGRLNSEISSRLTTAGAPLIDAFYYCPHHPNADLPEYRMDCDCRKPRPGLLLRAARDHGIELKTSYMVGDRPTDIMAGARAGCRTVLVETGAHRAPLIETAERTLSMVPSDFACGSLAEAADWILAQA